MTEQQWRASADPEGAAAVASAPPGSAEDATPAGPTPPGSAELLTFGEPGRLRPVPRRVTDQPAEALAHVPDTAIEWADHADAQQPGFGLRLRGISTRGHSHRYEGSVRQDQLAAGQVGQAWVLVVADGVGGEPQSHLGAALAARYVASWPAVESLADSARTEFSCAEVAQVLQYEARQRGLDPRTVSTTLTFAVISLTPTRDESGSPCWRVVVAQVGDSHAYLLRGDEWTRVTSSDAEPNLSNVVDPLPKYAQAQVRHFDAATGDVLALTTDGAGNLLEDNQDFARALAELWTVSAPTPAALLSVLDAAVKSYDDDRTFLAVRFGDD